MSITAADVNKLRKQTGAGMMDCKKALTEANGDFDMAIDLLRKKGQKVAAKRGDRETTEGLVFASVSEGGKRGTLVAVNCETDFVAKNEDFVAFAQNILSVAEAEKPANLEALNGLSYPGESITIAEKISEQIGKIGEKIEVGSYEVIDAGHVVAYNHPGNGLASLVGFNKSAGDIDESGRQVAMQVAAMAPLAVDKDGVSQEVIDKEIEVGKELAIQEGKPAEMAEKIAMGRLNKFFKENTLLNQAFVRDNKVSVKQFVESVDKELQVTEFKRFSLK